MEYKKIMNSLDNTQDQPSKFRANNWVQINNDADGMYNTNSQTKFKTSMLKSSLCYSHTYIIVSGTVTVAALAAGGRNNGKNLIFKNCAPFTGCISEINNTQVDNAKNINTAIII